MRGLDSGVSYGMKATTQGAELGGVRRLDVVGFSGGTAGDGQHGVEERTDRQGPCVSEGRKTSRRGWKA
jgi:hypothetical protein